MVSNNSDPNGRRSTSAHFGRRSTIDADTLELIRENLRTVKQAKADGVDLDQGAIDEIEESLSRIDRERSRR
jgi:hypothetical protein